VKGGFKESSIPSVPSTAKTQITAISEDQTFPGRIKEEKSMFYNHRLQNSIILHIFITMGYRIAIFITAGNKNS
jgi:hypothetical protein